MTAPPLNLTADQKQVVAWLREQGAPGVAEAYLCALEVITRGPFVGAGSLIAHCIRDILNTLGDAHVKVEGRVDYPKLVEILATAWQQDFSPTAAAHAAEGVGQAVAIGAGTRTAIVALLTEHRAGTQRDADKIRMALRVGAPAETDLDLLEPVRKTLGTVKKWAPDAAHFACLTEKNIDFDQAVEQFELVEQALVAKAKPFFEQMKAIDALLENANS